MNDISKLTPMNGRPFLMALLFNTIWVNVSGLPRYFLIIKPMLHDTFPSSPDIAPTSLTILVSWGLWTVLFLLASTGFYWMYFDRNGNTGRNVIVSALWLTTATIGLTWLGTVNMGLVPISFLFVAMIWATIEQIVSSYIVSHSMKMQQAGQGATTIAT